MGALSVDTVGLNGPAQVAPIGRQANDLGMVIRGLTPCTRRGAARREGRKWICSLVAWRESGKECSSREGDAIRFVRSLVLGLELGRYGGGRTRFWPRLKMKKERLPDPSHPPCGICSNSSWGKRAAWTRIAHQKKVHTQVKRRIVARERERERARGCVVCSPRGLNTPPSRVPKDASESRTAKGT